MEKVLLLKMASEISLKSDYVKNEFENALNDAGFSSVQFLGKGLSDFAPDSNTLYCVATKYR